MFKKILVLFGLNLISLSPTLADHRISIGHTTNIHSTILDENREIQVYLPPSYNDYHTQKYPTIYLLDGESNFHYLTGMVEKLSKFPYPSIPEMIIIGIINTDRSRDLTPTAQKSDDQQFHQRIQSSTGGNNNFFQFLEHELMPKINEQYRTDGFNILIGHSFGGITALNHMLNGTVDIQAYIVHDPSIWWDKEVMLQRFQQVKDKDFNNTILFLTQVGETENKGHLTSHYSGIQKFNHYLNTEPFAHLDYQYKQYEDEDHGSIPMIGNLDALRYIFKDMRINIKEIPKNPNLVKEQYAKLSHSLNYEIKPSKPYLESILNYLKRSASSNAIEEFKNYIWSIYPTKEP